MVKTWKWNIFTCHYMLSLFTVLYLWNYQFFKNALFRTLCKFNQFILRNNEVRQFCFKYFSLDGYIYVFEVWFQYQSAPTIHRIEMGKLFVSLLGYRIKLHYRIHQWYSILLCTEGGWSFLVLGNRICDHCGDICSRRASCKFSKLIRKFDLNFIF